jgi:hypothetical protein
MSSIHMSADECWEQRQWYHVHCNGIRIDNAVEVQTGEDGFVLLTMTDTTGGAWDESDPGATVALHGHVTLELIVV